MIYMFVGKGKGENKNLKEFVWTTIFKIFSQKYLVVRRITKSQFLVVLTKFLVVEMIMENREMVMEKSWKNHRKTFCQVCGNPGWYEHRGPVLHVVGESQYYPSLSSMGKGGSKPLMSTFVI